MKSKIALSLVCLSVFLLAAVAVAQVGTTGYSSENVAAKLAPASATDGVFSSAGITGGASVGSATGTTDVLQIREAVDRFGFLFGRRDADLLKSEIWPAMSSKAYSQLKNTFKVVSQLSLQENCAGAPVVVSGSAEWICTERLGYEVEGETRPSQIHTLRFHLKKVDGKWYVEGRTVAR